MAPPTWMGHEERPACERDASRRREIPHRRWAARRAGFAAALRDRSNAVLVAPGPRHWTIFERLCTESGARGNLVPDAYHAALAIESGSEWITTDRDYGRFPGLRWRHPLAGWGSADAAVGAAALR